MTERHSFHPDMDDVVDRQDVPNEVPNDERTLARSIALQCLYELDVTHHDVDGVIQNNLLAYASGGRTMRRRVRALVEGVRENRERIDLVLTRYAPDWPIEQVAVIDRNVIRIAVFEFAIDRSTPVGVAIDEAVGLARTFGADGAMRVVNGVLGSMAQDIHRVLEDLEPAPGDES
jgi:transcription antitermination protein NusB